jgi:hypothetical protein
LELRVRAVAERIVAKCREEQCLGPPASKLHGSDGATTGWHFEHRPCVHDVAGGRYVVDARELDPFDVTDDSDAHARAYSMRRSNFADLRFCLQLDVQACVIAA